MKTRKKNKYIFIGLSALLLFNIHVAYGQNEYPTAKGSHMKLDGGGIILASPVITGGWARGISFNSSDVSNRYLSLGLLGSGTDVTRFYIGFGNAAPWNSPLGLHILPNGNVGIGVMTPQARLAVNGNILAKEIKVKTDITVPDYVFEETYNLPSLSSVENYVREHKHLPEIPSAKDIEKDGLDLAEMNLLLLKKVEELTLHLIEKEKQVLHLEQGMQTMEDRISKLEAKN